MGLVNEHVIWGDIEIKIDTYSVGKCAILHVIENIKKSSFYSIKK
jgi:hypothetical protein